MEPPKNPLPLNRPPLTIGTSPLCGRRLPPAAAPLFQSRALLHTGLALKAWGPVAHAYPELFAVLGGQIPDLRGLFLRGHGGNSAALGVQQNDAIRNIMAALASTVRLLLEAFFIGQEAVLKIFAAHTVRGPVMAWASTSLVSFRPLKKTALLIRRFGILSVPGHRREAEFTVARGLEIVPLGCPAEPHWPQVRHRQRDPAHKQYSPSYRPMSP